MQHTGPTCTVHVYTYLSNVYFANRAGYSKIPVKTTKREQFVPCLPHTSQDNASVVQFYTSAVVPTDAIHDAAPTLIKPCLVTK